MKTPIHSKFVVLPEDDVDTDQIIPARFLKGTDKKGIGAHLFADWRGRPGFPLDDPAAADARILVCGRNFGCGSSREHAAWALAAGGFRVLIARSFADIFKENCAKNGLLAVTLDDVSCRRIEAANGAELIVDLAGDRVWLPDGVCFRFVIDPFEKHCLVNGLDELGYILSFEPQIAAHERRTP
jgi:3-isopropylmalate/(R)-2-methylmalate dehydratase small subunit